MSNTMNPEVESVPPRHGWKASVRPVLSYGIAIALTLAGPALMAGALILALLAGDASIIGLGLLAGAVLGAAGAVALLWCLAESRGSRSGDMA